MPRFHLQLLCLPFLIGHLHLIRANRLYFDKLYTFHRTNFLSLDTQTLTFAALNTDYGFMDYLHGHYPDSANHRDQTFEIKLPATERRQSASNASGTGTADDSDDDTDCEMESDVVFAQTRLLSESVQPDFITDVLYKEALLSPVL